MLGRGIGPGYTFGASLWLTRFLGIEGNYLKPRQVRASGGESFSFTSTQDTDVWTIAGKLGAQAGRVRIYGKAGANYHQATLKTTERIENASQSFEYKTTGWNWVFGGGAEIWLGQSHRAAIFGDAGQARIKGAAESGGEARIDDRLTYVSVGMKVHVGG